MKTDRYSLPPQQSGVKLSGHYARFALNRLMNVGAIVQFPRKTPLASSRRVPAFFLITLMLASAFETADGQTPFQSDLVPPRLSTPRPAPIPSFNGAPIQNTPSKMRTTTGSLKSRARPKNQVHSIQPPSIMPLSTPFSPASAPQVSPSASKLSPQTQKNTANVNASVRAGETPPKSRPPQRVMTLPKEDLQPQQSSPEAKKQLRQVIRHLAFGPSFDAKVRQRVWAAGREVVGVGTYEQAGNGTGHFNLQVTMHDGDGKHTMQQISDGRLAWTRTAISNRVTLGRVDVGRLNEWVRQSIRTGTKPDEIPARLKVGGWTEILDSIERDYILRLGFAHAKPSDVASQPGHSIPLLVITGRLSELARNRIQQENRIPKLPELFPATVKVAVQTEPNLETQFGQGLPVRIEYWSDPIETKSSDDTSKSEGRLISLIELYSIRPIPSPPIERFRFEVQDPSINFTNDTDRYLRRYNIRLTESQDQTQIR